MDRGKATSIFVIEHFLLPSPLAQRAWWGGVGGGGSIRGTAASVSRFAAGQVALD
jgi:hypothetical protein